jgi:hypothetical protein
MMAMFSKLLDAKLGGSQTNPTPAPTSRPPAPSSLISELKQLLHMGRAAPTPQPTTAGANDEAAVQTLMTKIDTIREAKALMAKLAGLNKESALLAKLRVRCC